MNTKKILFSFGISFVLIILLAFQVNWSLVLVELKTAQYSPLIMVTLIWMFHFLLRSIRWQFFLPAQTHSTLWQRFSSLMVGNLATFVLPLRAGEFIRPFFLSKISDVPFATGFISIVIERFLDLICVLSFFFIVSKNVPNLPSWAHDGVKGFSLLALAIFIFILFAAFLPVFLERLVVKVTNYFPQKLAYKIQELTKQVLVGAESIRSFKNLLAVVILTALIWGSNIIAFDYFLSVVSIPRDLGLSTTLTVLIALAVAAPSAPGFIGVYQVAAIASFALYGIAIEKATAYSLLNHLHQYVMIVGIGGYILLRSGMKLSELSKRS
jgi:uncharacterized protein (TIRG00374 family)